MAIVNPSIDGSVPGARWVLKKHTIFPREFAEVGATDLSGGGTYTDLDGDSWTLVVSGVPDTFALQSTGIYMQCTGAVNVGIGINPLSVIPGLRRRDSLWAIWKMVDVALPNNNNTALAKFRRRAAVNVQQGAWEFLRTGGNPQLNPAVTSSGTTASAANTLGAFQDYLVSINVTGLRYEYRNQLTTGIFPETPDPDDIPLFTTGSFDGYFAGEVRAAPLTEDIDLPNENLEATLNAAGAAQCEITFEEFWLYRLE